jgi:hypothetical protein
MSNWKDDLLGYKQIGETFTNLIKSIDTAKVISIEAGFGRGKTFFRRAWSKHLRESGEIVVEIDVRESDHTGDPVVTFLGALVEALPKEDKGNGKKALDAAKKFGVIGARSLVKVALRSGADEVLGALTDKASDKLEDFEALDNIINGVGEGMSKAAGQLIAAQMAAEKVRTEEMPKQLGILHEALTANTTSERVIIIIDELDRCHPDYAIAVLEAMKLVFDQKGFVFCLMVNAEYLENLARHRFGEAQDGEKYLDKFVDVRLRLESTNEAINIAVTALASTLPIKTPFADGIDFSAERAAMVAGQLAAECSLPMRKVKRILMKVDIVLRCYSDQPLDAPLLVFLAFEDAVGKPLDYSFLPRAQFDPKYAQRQTSVIGDPNPFGENPKMIELNRRIAEEAPELLKLPIERYGPEHDERHYDWHKVFKSLAPDYIPSHRRYLNAVAELLVPDTIEAAAEA